MTEMVLTRSVLRPPRPSDAASIAREAANREVWLNLGDRFPYPYSLVDAEAFIASVANEAPTHTFAIVVDGEAVGIVGLEPGDHVHRRAMMIGYWLGEPYWNRGITTEVVIAATAHAFETFDVNRIWAGVFAWNPASARVLEKSGYVFEGRLRNAITKDGETTDELIYAVVR